MEWCGCENGETDDRSEAPRSATPGGDLRDDVDCPESDGKAMAEAAALRLREELARLRGDGGSLYDR